MLINGRVPELTESTFLEVSMNALELALKKKAEGAEAEVQREKIERAEALRIAAKKKIMVDGIEEILTAFSEAGFRMEKKQRSGIVYWALFHKKHVLLGCSLQYVTDSKHACPYAEWRVTVHSGRRAGPHGRPTVYLENVKTWVVEIMAKYV